MISKQRDDCDKTQRSHLRGRRAVRLVKMVRARQSIRRSRSRQPSAGSWQQAKENSGERESDEDELQGISHGFQRTEVGWRRSEVRA